MAQCARPKFWFVLDVETIGIHGQAFAAGWVVVDEDGVEHEARRVWCHPIEAIAPAARPEDEAASRAWVEEHVPWTTWPTGDGCYVSCPRKLRDAFWSAWCAWRDRGAWLAADVAWPCEARFLIECIDDRPERAAQGPYPLVDVASVRLAAGHDPVETCARRESELPAHDPLADARQSARLLLEIVGRTDGPF